MREVYMHCIDFRKAMNPKKRKHGLSVVTNIEKLLSPTGAYLLYPEGCKIQPFEEVSPIRFNLLLTNKSHDGIWLNMDNQRNCIEIPNKIMDEETLFDIKQGNFNEAILGMFIKVVTGCKSHLDGAFLPLSIEYAFKFSIDNGLGLECISSGISIFYNFYSEYKNEINIFGLVEVAQPEVVLSNFFENDLLWYSRSDHSYNRNKHDSARYVFDAGYKHDVRFSDIGFELLDIIFSTENIFGKLDIY